MSAHKQTLAEFFSVVLAPELKGTGIEAEVRSTVDGCELRLRYQEYGVVTISNEALEAADANRADFFDRRATEAIGLARQMKASLVEAGNGKSRFYEREES